MKAGTLRHRVTLQRDVGADDDADGQHVPEWEDVGTYWAEVMPLVPAEEEGGHQVRAFADHRLTMRAGPVVTPRRRFLFGSRILQVASVVDSGERGRELVVICREEVNSP